MRLRALGLLVLVIVAIVVATARAFDDRLADGADAWDAGDVAAATTAWRAEVGPRPSGALAYDLGAAAFRSGDLPRAIAWWRTARVQHPRDPDVAHNLALARAGLPGLPRPVAAPAAWMELASPSELALLAIGFLAGFSALVGEWRRERGDVLALAVCCGLIGASAAVSAWQGDVLLERHPVCVAADPLTLRAGPDPAERARTELPAGSETRLLRQHRGFALIETGDGRSGWAPLASLHVGAPDGIEARTAGLGGSPPPERR